MKKMQSIQYRIQTLLTMTILITFISTASLLGYEFWQISKQSSVELAKLYNTKWMYNFENHIRHDVLSLERISNSKVLRDWLTTPDDSTLQKDAFIYLRNQLDQFSKKNLTVVLIGSQESLFMNRTTTYEQYIASSHTFSNDGFAFLNSPKNIFLSVDRSSATLSLRIDYKVEENVGLLSTAIDYESLSNAIYKDLALPGVKTILINNKGEIIIDSDISSLSDNGDLQSLNPNKQFHKYALNESFKLEALNYFNRPEENYTIALKDSPFDYAVFTPFHAVDLHVLTYISTQKKLGLEHYLPLAFALVSLMAILYFVISKFIFKSFIEPLDALNSSLTNIKTPEEIKIVGLDRLDEIGEMARAFQKVTNRMIHYVPVGIFILDNTYSLTYANQYFLKQFGLTNREQFKEIIHSNPKSIFASPEDFDRIVSLIAEDHPFYVFEVELLSSNLRPFWAEIHLEKTFKDQIVRFEGVLLSIHHEEHM
jgi:PAS domain-containing protein